MPIIFPARRHRQIGPSHLQEPISKYNSAAPKSEAEKGFFDSKVEKQFKSLQSRRKVQFVSWNWHDLSVSGGKKKGGHITICKTAILRADEQAKTDYHVRRPLKDKNPGNDEQKQPSRGIMSITPKQKEMIHICTDTHHVAQMRKYSGLFLQHY